MEEPKRGVIADFIRNNPDLEPDELVGWASENGLQITEKQIAVVRSRDNSNVKAARAKMRMSADDSPAGPRGGKPKSKSKPAEPAKPPPLRGLAYGEKSAFILSHPDVTADDLVRLARERGIRMSAGYVHSTRWRYRDREQSGLGPTITSMVADASRAKGGRRPTRPTPSSVPRELEFKAEREQIREEHKLLRKEATELLRRLEEILTKLRLYAVQESR